MRSRRWSGANSACLSTTGLAMADRPADPGASWPTASRMCGRSPTYTAGTGSAFSAARVADRTPSPAPLSFPIESADARYCPGIKPADDGKPSLGEPELRSQLAEVADEIMARIDAGGPEMPTEPGPAARDDPDAMARLRATFLDSMDGWVDDSLAFARPWNFNPETITAPVAIWHGTEDANVSTDHADWLHAGQVDDEREGGKAARDMSPSGTGA